MDIVECEALCGLLLWLGSMKQGFANTEILWDSVDGFPKIRACMSRRRFQLLMTHLRFDDKTARTAHRQKDAFTPFRDIWDEFMKNLSQHYVPGCLLTVDEQLVPFRGRCSFLQYLPSKPDRYGITVGTVGRGGLKRSWLGAGLLCQGSRVRSPQGARIFD